MKTKKIIEVKLAKEFQNPEEVADAVIKVIFGKKIGDIMIDKASGKELRIRSDLVKKKNL